MSAHHQGAIDMAQTAESKAQKTELKSFARKIVKDQQREIAQMRQWRDKWYSRRPQAMNMEMPGMMDSMKAPNTEGIANASLLGLVPRRYAACYSFVSTSSSFL